MIISDHIMQLALYPLQLTPNRALYFRGGGATVTCWLVSMEKGRLERRGILTQWTKGREREKQRKMKGGGTKTVDQDKRETKKDEGRGDKNSRSR